MTSAATGALPYDAIIKDGRWFDGTGAASAVRNLGVRDGRVATVSTDVLDESGCPEVVDAAGQWVIPGLVDIHTHYDVEVLSGPGLSESVRHGVTTMLLGSCSLSTVHVGGVDAGDLFGRVEAIPRQLVISAVEERQDLELGRGVRRRARGTAARTQPRRLHRPLRPADRDHGPGPGHPQGGPADAALSRPGWSRCSTRRSTPASSACRPSSCSSTRSTATCAARGRCRRRTPGAGRCADCATILRRRRSGTPGRTGREPPAHASSSRRWDRSAWRRREPLQDQPAVGRRHQGDPVRHPPDAAAGAVVEPARRGLPLAAPAGAVRGLRRRHRPGDLRGVRLRRRRPAPAGGGRARRAVARPGRTARRFRKDYESKYGPRVWHRDFFDADIVACPDSSVVGKSFGQVGVERGGLHPVDAFLDLVLEHGTAHPLADHDLQPPAPGAQEDGRATRASRSASPTPAPTCATWPSTTSGSGCCSTSTTPSWPGRPFMSRRARRAPADRRARRVVPASTPATLRVGDRADLRGAGPGPARRLARRLPREPGRAVRRTVPDGQPQRRRRARGLRRRPAVSSRTASRRRCSARSAPASSSGPSRAGAAVGCDGPCPAA